MKPTKSQQPYKISQAEFDALIQALTNLWRYDILTDSQYDQAINRLEKMYTTKPSLKDTAAYKEAEKLINQKGHR